MAGGKKPFFYRIDISALFDFATDPDGMKMSLLQFAKELQKEKSDIPYIQGLIDETKDFITKKAAAGKKGMENRWLKNSSDITNDNTVITVLSSDITNDNTPVTRSSNRNSTETIKPTIKRFVPPSIDEVTAYCQERKNSVDPQKWISHYTANGWRVGKNKMVDWKAAVRTWEGNGNGRSGTTSGAAQAGRKTGFYEANLAGTDFLS